MKASSTIFISFVLFLVFLAGAMTSAVVSLSRDSARLHYLLNTIPLRDDQRKQQVQKAEAPIQNALFLDDTTLIYQSGNCLRLRSLIGNAPEIVFRGHTKPIQIFRISPDKKRIITSSMDGTLRSWDSRSGECLAVSSAVDTTAQPEWTLLHEIVFHPNGKTLQTADMEGFKIWRTRDLTLLSSEQSDLLYMCTGLLSPDWKTLCVPVLDEGFQIVSCRDEGILEFIGRKDPLSYSPDGKRVLAVNDENGTMEIWDIYPLANGERLSVLWLYSPSAPLKSAAFSPDGNQLVSAHGDGTIRIWNARNGAEREILHWSSHETDGVCFSPDGNKVAAWNTSSGDICIWGPFNWGV